MTPWSVYEFLDGRGRSTIRGWLEAEKVQKGQVATFRAKIDAFKRGGPEMNPGLIHGPIKKKKLKITGIYKMKIKGSKGWVQLRPMLCFGPFSDDKNTITLLVGAVEKGSELEPADYLERAAENRTVLLNDRTRRRNLNIPREIEA
jgi:hypothetical protein